MNFFEEIKKSSSLSFILPCFNGASTLKLCIQALYDLDELNSFNYEIILVDNNSTDNSVQIARQFSEIKIVKEDKQGRSQARNRGIQIARGDIIIFLDIDTLLSKSWLVDILSEIGELAPSKWGLATSVIIKKKLKDSLFENVRVQSIDSSNSLNAVNNNMPFVNSAALIIKKKVLDSIGGFDHELNYFEDLDLGRRVALKNYVLVASKAEISCFFGYDYLSYLKRNFYVGGMSLSFIKKWEKVSEFNSFLIAGKIIWKSLVFIFESKKSVMEKLFLYVSKIFELFGLLYFYLFRKGWRRVESYPFSTNKFLLIKSSHRSILFNIHLKKFKIFPVK